MEFEATLKTPGLVVVADQYYPGWELEVNGKRGGDPENEPGDAGVALPAGTHRSGVSVSSVVGSGGGGGFGGGAGWLSGCCSGVRGPAWEGEQGASLARMTDDRIQRCGPGGLPGGAGGP